MLFTQASRRFEWDAQNRTEAPSPALLRLRLQSNFPRMRGEEIESRSRGAFFCTRVIVTTPRMIPKSGHRLSDQIMRN
jgi:hypothetical protein